MLNLHATSPLTCGWNCHGRQQKIQMLKGLYGMLIKQKLFQHFSEFGNYLQCILKLLFICHHSLYWQNHIPPVLPKRQTFPNSYIRTITMHKTLIVKTYAVTVKAESNCAYFSSYSKAFKHKVNIFPLAAVISYTIHIQSYFLWFKAPSWWGLNLQTISVSKKMKYLQTSHSFARHIN
jgi:hypothetical protein